RAEVAALPDGEADPDLIQLLDYAEQWAESGARPEGRGPGGLGFRWHPLVARNAFDAANWTIRQTTGSKPRIDCLPRECRNKPEAVGRQGGLLRELFGTPFRPVALDPLCRSPSVVALAEMVYRERSFEQLPILADALEDAGCSAADVFGHCRGPGPHVRGC